MKKILTGDYMIEPFPKRAGDTLYPSFQEDEKKGLDMKAFPCFWMCVGLVLES